MSNRVAVIGGGAAGFFAAIACLETDPQAKVVILEKTRQVLAKVRISGGGRCNVTHACFDPKELVQRYPRGARELLGPFYAWQPSDTVAWFKARGVTLKTEADGRMFPTTDSSETIVECLVGRARELGVELRLQADVQKLTVDPSGAGYQVALKDGGAMTVDRVVIASGGGERSGGLKIAAELGHTITQLAPSLFTFHIDDPRIDGLQGLSTHEVAVSCPTAKLEQSGPMLITHWGLSGPAVLKLSAWGARALAELNYVFEIRINWLGGTSLDAATERLREMKNSTGKRSVRAHCPFDLPRRIWERLVEAGGVGANDQWAQLGKIPLQALAKELVDGAYQVKGKSMNKEEFVTCGGVKLGEVDFKRMESKLAPGAHFAGEVLDIDGVTGGFNFQAAWTTGRIAGSSAAEG